MRIGEAAVCLTFGLNERLGTIGGRRLFDLAMREVPLSLLSHQVTSRAKLHKDGPGLREGSFDLLQRWAIGILVNNPVPRAVDIKGTQLGKAFSPLEVRCIGNARGNLGLGIGP